MAAQSSCLRNMVHGDSPRLSATIEDEESTITKPKDSSPTKAKNIPQRVRSG